MAEKKPRRRSPRLDATDLAILRILQSTAKITNANLAERVGISPPSTLERVKKLEARGVIRRYVAILNEAALSKSLSAIVHVSLKDHSATTLAEAKTRLAELEEVMACWYCAGEEDFILKVLVTDMAAYERFVSQRLSTVTGIAKLRTAFILDAVKDTTTIPLDHDSGRERARP